MTIERTKVTRKDLNKNCPCCSEFNNLGIFMPYRKGRCLAQSSNFVIFPAVGSITYPYLILEPKFHINSFSKLNKSLLIEAEQLTSKFLNSSKKKYEIIVAEHGENFKSLEHAHIHFIMFDKKDIETNYWENLKRFSKINKSNYSLNDFFHLLLEYRNETEYTLILSVLRNNVIGFNSEAIPSNNRSQFIRRVLAEIIKKPWNWLAFEGTENIEKAYTEFNFEKIRK